MQQLTERGEISKMPPFFGRGGAHSGTKDSFLVI
jgi:hypothetical protein